MNNDTLPWIEKYRPYNIDDIISNNENIKILTSMLNNGSLPHLLFYGSSGTGKTSLILALARQLYGNDINLMVMKLDASDDRGINSVREEIKGFAERKNMFSNGVKLIILDEADSMTFDAQFALRKIIEKYSVTTRFCLICNYENKIIPAIRSRCANFRFNPLPNDKIITILEKISKNEKLIYNDNSLKIIANICNGDLRKSINLLQSVSMKSNILTEDSCYESAGLPPKKDLNIIFDSLLNPNHSFENIYTQIYNKVKLNGYSLGIILKELTIYLINNDKLFNQKKNAQLYSNLSDLETKVSQSTFDDIYISALISIFCEKDIV
jgi:replication factor C subunit 3/5